jgi:hypothetical protein
MCRKHVKQDLDWLQQAMRVSDSDIHSRMIEYKTMAISSGTKLRDEDRQYPIEEKQSVPV